MSEYRNLVIPSLSEKMDLEINTIVNGKNLRDMPNIALNEMRHDSYAHDPGKGGTKNLILAFACGLELKRRDIVASKNIK